MEYLFIFVFTFLIVYLVYYQIIIRRKKGLEAFRNGKQLLFFKNAYKMDIDNIDCKKFANSLSLTNAFIIALTVTVTELLDGLVIKMLVGFVILIPLILICYFILGKVYKKKEGKKNI